MGSLGLFEGRELITGLYVAISSSMVSPAFMVILRYQPWNLGPQEPPTVRRIAPLLLFGMLWFPWPPQGCASPWDKYGGLSFWWSWMAMLGFKSLHQPPAQVFSGEKVEVEVMHGLACVFAAVGQESPAAFGHTEFGGYGFGGQG